MHRTSRCGSAPGPTVGCVPDHPGRRAVVVPPRRRASGSRAADVQVNRAPPGQPGGATDRRPRHDRANVRTPAPGGGRGARAVPAPPGGIVGDRAGAAGRARGGRGSGHDVGPDGLGGGVDHRRLPEPHRGGDPHPPVHVRSARETSQAAGERAPVPTGGRPRAHGSPHRLRRLSSGRRPSRAVTGQRGRVGRTSPALRSSPGSGPERHFCGDERSAGEEPGLHPSPSVALGRAGGREGQPWQGQASLTTTRTAVTGPPVTSRVTSSAGAPTRP